MRRAMAILLVLLVVPVASRAAEDLDSLGTDEAFARARSLAFSGEREEAREICRTILRRSPNYHDVRVFLGRVHAWDHDYVAAKRELTRVLDRRPDYVEARKAMIDIEIWEDHPEAALWHVEQGLALEPGNGDLLYRKARLLDRTGRSEQAVPILREALDHDPRNRDARRLLRRLYDNTLRNKFSVDHEVTTFDDSTDNWNETSVQYRRDTKAGSVLGRVNFARRFSDTGTQLEVDAYPGIARKTYLFLNAGVSGSSLFPDLRYAAEIYHNFPRGWEASLGFRRLEFDSSDVTIYTGTIAKYFGPYWLSLRPNHVEKQDGTSNSAGLTLRRYFNGRYEYLEISVGGGSSDEILGPEDLIAAREEESLDSLRARVEIRRRVTNKVVLKGLVGWREEDLTAERSRGSLFFGFGVERFF